MHLLSPQESRSKTEAYNSKLSSRSADLDEAIVAKRKELISLDEEFLRTLQNQRLVRLKEDTEWEQRNRTLTSEVEALENRRKLAVVPLAEKKKELQDREEVLLQREQKVSAREQEAADNLELLEGRLDEASDRLDSAGIREKQLNKREEGIKLQERQTNERTLHLNEVLSKSYALLNEAQTKIATQKAEQDGREIVLSEKESRLKERENDLVSRETALIDKRTTLERAVEEMKRTKLF